MITSQIIKTSLDELKNITRIDLAIFDVTGKMVVSTYDEELPEAGLVYDFAKSHADSQVIGLHHFL